MKRLQRQPHSFILGRAMGLPGRPIYPLKAENGFTLVEVLVVVSIAALITVAIVGTIIGLMRLSPPSREQAVALRQVQNAGQWLTLDINMASKVERPADASPTILKLTQPRWDEEEGKYVDTTVTYRMDGEKLLRDKKKAGEEIVHTITVAENVGLALYLPNDANKPECCAQQSSAGPSPVFCLVVTSEVKGVGGVSTVKRCYQATPRVAQ